MASATRSLKLFYRISRLFHCSVVKVLFVCLLMPGILVLLCLTNQLFDYTTLFCFCQQLFIVLTEYVVGTIRSFSTALTVYHILYGLSSTFSTFFNFLKMIEKSKRRKRDLNPRAAINDLLPFQGSPFSRLGISPYYNHIGLMI